MVVKEVKRRYLRLFCKKHIVSYLLELTEFEGEEECNSRTHNTPTHIHTWAFLAAQMLKNLPAMRETPRGFNPWVRKIP